MARSVVLYRLTINNCRYFTTTIRQAIWENRIPSSITARHVPCVREPELAAKIAEPPAFAHLWVRWRVA